MALRSPCLPNTATESLASALLSSFNWTGKCFDVGYHYDIPPQRRRPLSPVQHQRTTKFALRREEEKSHVLVWLRQPLLIK